MSYTNNYSVYVDSFPITGGDNTTQINAALAAVRALVSTAVISAGVTVQLVFSSKVYTVSGTGLNATVIRGINWVIDGNGATLRGLCTGYPVLDMLGSRYFAISNLNIWGDSSNTPTFGIQYGKYDAAVVVGDSTFYNVNIQGTFSVANLYLYSTETTYYAHLKLYNASVAAGSYCLILDSNNYQNITSAFVSVTIPVGTPSSFNEQYFQTADMRKQNGGKCVRIMGDAISRCYFMDSYGVSVDDAVIEIYNVLTIKDLWLDLHAETTGSTLYMSIDNVNPSGNVNMLGLRIRDHNPQSSVALIDLTGATRTVLLDNCDIDFGVPSNSVPLFGSTAGSANFILASGRIAWPDTKTLDISNCIFNGEILTLNNTTITNTAGSYGITRRPTTSAQRVRQVKGILQVAGTSAGTDLTNYVEMEGAGTGTSPRITAKGDTNIGLKVIGGAGTTSTLTYQTTSGVGASGADHIFLVGNNGATEAMRIINNGSVGIGITPTVPFHVRVNNSNASATMIIEQSGSGDAALDFLLTATRAWVIGIDNSDSDKFKFSPANDGFASAVITVETGGNTTFTGTVTASNLPSTFKQTVSIPASAMSPRTGAGQAGCAALATTNGASNQPDIEYLAFDDTTPEYARFCIAMPKSWNEGTVTASFAYRRATGTAAENVVWGIRALAVSTDETPAANFGTGATVTSAASTTTANFILSAETSACTIGGSPSENDLVFFEIYRDAGAGGDTLTGDAWLTAVKLYYTTNSLTDA